MFEIITAVSVWAVLVLIVLEAVQSYASTYINRKFNDEAAERTQQVYASPFGILGHSDLPGVMLHERVHMLLLAPHLLPFVPIAVWLACVLTGQAWWITLLATVLSKIPYLLLHEVIADLVAWLTHGQAYTESLAHHYVTVTCPQVDCSLGEYLLKAPVYIHRYFFLRRVWPTLTAS